MTSHSMLIRPDDRQDDTQRACPPSHTYIVLVEMIATLHPEHGLIETREIRFWASGIGQNRQFFVATNAPKCSVGVE